MRPLKKTTINSPVGLIKTAVSVKGMNRFKIKKWLRNYFNGYKKNQFTARYLDLLEGTPFQKRVWRQLLKIPFGETRSYGWIAKKMGLNGGAQAVGQVVKKNPVPILIPCHRVIASDGSVGGYSSGVSIKKKLLRHEGVKT